MRRYTTAKIVHLAFTAALAAQIAARGVPRDLGGAENIVDEDMQGALFVLDASDQGAYLVGHEMVDTVTRVSFRVRHDCRSLEMRTQDARSPDGPATPARGDAVRVPR